MCENLAEVEVGRYDAPPPPNAVKLDCNSDPYWLF